MPTTFYRLPSFTGAFYDRGDFQFVGALDSDSMAGDVELHCAVVGDVGDLTFAGSVAPPETGKQRERSTNRAS